MLAVVVVVLVLDSVDCVAVQGPLALRLGCSAAAVMRGIFPDLSVRGVVGSVRGVVGSVRGLADALGAVGVADAENSR